MSDEPEVGHEIAELTLPESYVDMERLREAKYAIINGVKFINPDYLDNE